MICAILPVKSPRNAKQRLVNFLSAADREALAWRLYRQTLATLCRASGIDTVVVATSDPGVAAHARSEGVAVFDEEEQVSHSVSADAACLRAKEMGAGTVLLVPIDVPLVSPSDFTALAAAARRGSAAGAQNARGLIVVPSSDGTGTNALARTPPDVIESRFGPGSFRIHLAQAKAKGVPSDVLLLEGLMFDIDTPEDVAELFSRAPVSPISEFLRSVCVSK